MNDFSKEELKEIINAMCGCEGAFTIKEYAKLTKKIYFMIENYCEHSFNLFGDGCVTYPKCHKCGRVVP